jgi:MarR family transcriptional regulator, organic hydroperoxide resistance regulator
MQRAATTDNLGFLLAKASQRWNELLGEAFSERGQRQVRPSYGSLLLPLWEEDGLRMGELARRARLAKQTMTTMVRLMERDGLLRREPDPDDRRASRVHLTARARRLRPVADDVVGALTERVEGRLSARRMRDTERALRMIADL